MRAMMRSSLLPLVDIRPSAAPMMKASASAQTAVCNVLPRPSRKLSRCVQTVDQDSNENKPDMANSPFPTLSWF